MSALIGLGSNLGDRRAHLDRGLRRLSELPGTRIVRISGYLETDPVGPVPQGRYLNAAAELRTSLEPGPLLRAMLEIERECGRNREAEVRWGPRTLDLDLLLYGDHVIEEPGLRVPHPRLQERLFVLIPLAEIAGDTLVPGLDQSVGELLREARRNHERGERPTDGAR